jgi:cation/acetate symporter
VSAPALATLVKFEEMNNQVGSSVDSLPPWIAQWAKVDPSLNSVADINGDRTLQWGEIRLGADIIMLATPELGGLPYVVSGLVAAGGLAAALSTADGLLLTISNALVRDIYCHEINPHVTPEQRVILSKFALLAVAMIAAMAASLKPAEILPLVSASFSLAASAFVPAMVLGIFWRRADRRGAVAGMLAGLGVTLYYLLVNAPPVRAALGLAPGLSLWFGIQPLSAGVFGVPVGFVVAAAVSLWRAPRAATVEQA